MSSVTSFCPSPKLVCLAPLMAALGLLPWTPRKLKEVYQELLFFL